LAVVSVAAEESGEAGVEDDSPDVDFAAEAPGGRVFGACAGRAAA
jgi:hypothetical protein